MNNMIIARRSADCKTGAGAATTSLRCRHNWKSPTARLPARATTPSFAAVTLPSLSTTLPARSPDPQARPQRPVLPLPPPLAGPVCWAQVSWP